MKIDRKLLKKASRIKKAATEEELDLYSYILERAERISEEILTKIKSSPLDEGGMVFIGGPQNSGKSVVGCKLLVECKKIKRDGGAVAVQPEVDRPDVVKGLIYSRSGVACTALSFNSKAEIEALLHDHSIVIADEVHFIPYELQSFFLKEAEQFVERGGWLVCIGLKYTSLQSEFLLSSLLFERSDIKYELDATCQMCGRRGAIRNQRLVKGKTGNYQDPDLEPPSDEVSYEPRCMDCLVV